MIVRNPKTDEVIDSPFDDQEAIDKCAGMDDSFANSLAEKYERYTLSPAQWFWVHKKAMSSDRSFVQLKEGAYERIMILFQRATASHLKWPKARIKTPEGTVTFYRHNAGHVGVKCGDAHVGKIEVGDKFTPFKSCKDRTRELVKVVGVNPVAAFALWGREMGICCFCMQELSDERSVGAGYGPICAEKWGLPWG